MKCVPPKTYYNNFVGPHDNKLVRSRFDDGWSFEGPKTENALPTETTDVSEKMKKADDVLLTWQLTKRGEEDARRRPCCLDRLSLSCQSQSHSLSSYKCKCKKQKL